MGYSIRSILTLSVKTGSFQVITAPIPVNVRTISRGQPVTFGFVLSNTSTETLQERRWPSMSSAMKFTIVLPTEKLWLRGWLTLMIFMFVCGSGNLNPSVKLALLLGNATSISIGQFMYGVTTIGTQITGASELHLLLLWQYLTEGPASLYPCLQYGTQRCPNSRCPWWHVAGTRPPFFGTVSAAHFTGWQDGKMRLHVPELWQVVVFCSELPLAATSSNPCVQFTVQWVPTGMLPYRAVHNFGDIAPRTGASNILQ